MAACRTVLPFSTVTGCPSMVSVTVSIEGKSYQGHGRPRQCPGRALQSGESHPAGRTDQPWRAGHPQRRHRQVLARPRPGSEPAGDAGGRNGSHACPRPPRLCPRMVRGRAVSGRDVRRRRADRPRAAADAGRAGPGRRSGGGFSALGRFPPGPFRCRCCSCTTANRSRSATASRPSPHRSAAAPKWVDSSPTAARTAIG